MPTCGKVLKSNMIYNMNRKGIFIISLLICIIVGFYLISMKYYKPDVIKTGHVNDRRINEIKNSVSKNKGEIEPLSTLTEKVGVHVDAQYIEGAILEKNPCLIYNNDKGIDALKSLLVKVVLLLSITLCLLIQEFYLD